MLRIGSTTIHKKTAICTFVQDMKMKYANRLRVPGTHDQYELYLYAKLKEILMFNVILFHFETLSRLFNNILVEYFIV